MTLRQLVKGVLFGGILGGILLIMLSFLLENGDITFDMAFDMFVLGFPFGCVISGVYCTYKYVGSMSDRKFSRDRELVYEKNEAAYRADVDRLLLDHAEDVFDDYEAPRTAKEMFLTNTEAEDRLLRAKKMTERLNEFLLRYALEDFETGVPAGGYMSEALENSSWVSDALVRRLHDPEEMKSVFREIRDGVMELDRMLRVVSLGNRGERVVMDELRRYGDRFVVLDGIRFATREAVNDTETDGKTVENDVLVFTENGLFTLEVKNIMSEGERYVRISKDGIWYTKTSEDGSWKADPNTTKIFSQVNRQVHYTESLIERKIGKRIPLKSVIVIANDNVQIENETDWLIVRPNMLFSLLSGRSDFDVSLTEADREELVQMFKTYDLGAGKFPVRVFEEDLIAWEKNAEILAKQYAFMKDAWEVFQLSAFRDRWL